MRGDSRRQISHHDGDEDQRGETRLPREECVVLTARPDGDEKRGFAQPGDAFGKVSVIAAEQPFAPGEHQQTEQDADGNAARRSNPVVVEGEFQKVRDGEEQRDDPDAIEPAAADERFEVVRGRLVGWRAEVLRKRWDFARTDGRRRNWRVCCG